MRELRWEHRPTLFYIIKFGWSYVKSEEDPSKRAEIATQFAQIFGPLVIRKIVPENIGAVLDVADVPIMKTYVEGQNTFRATDILKILILEQQDILVDVETNFQKRQTALSQKEDRLQRITVRQSRMILEDDERHLELLRELWEMLVSPLSFPTLSYHSLVCPHNWRPSFILNLPCLNSPLPLAVPALMPSEARLFTKWSAKSNRRRWKAAYLPGRKRVIWRVVATVVYFQSPPKFGLSMASKIHLQHSEEAANWR
jgi:hypothetical protein